MPVSRAFSLVLVFHTSAVPAEFAFAGMDASAAARRNHFDVERHFQIGQIAGASCASAACLWLMVSRFQFSNASSSRVSSNSES